LQRPAFPNLFVWGNLKIIFLSQRTLTYENVYKSEKVDNVNHNWPKQNKETVGNIQQLLQYYQLLDKNSRDILMDI
jgi:hypothetical protein